MSEKDRKKAERDRKRQAEREKQENKKRFSLTPEKKRALKLLIMKIAAEQLAEELARKEKAKKDFLDSRVKPIPPDLASLNEAQLVSLCKDIHAQITTAEEERYTAEMKIRKTDYDVCIIFYEYSFYYKNLKVIIILLYKKKKRLTN
jgi:hypothetical protein